MVACSTSGVSISSPLENLTSQGSPSIVISDFGRAPPSDAPGLTSRSCRSGTASFARTFRTTSAISCRLSRLGNGPLRHGVYTSARWLTPSAP